MYYTHTSNFFLGRKSNDIEFDLEVTKCDILVTFDDLCKLYRTRRRMFLTIGRVCIHINIHQTSVSRFDAI